MSTIPVTRRPPYPGCRARVGGPFEYDAAGQLEGAGLETTGQLPHEPIIGAQGNVQLGDNRLGAVRHEVTAITA
jgi:hypothetical protein